MKIAVVIPTHKSKLTDNESISFDLCIKNLGSHDIIVATGSGNDPEFIRNKPEIKTIRFKSSDFKSENSYNRLLLSKRFYEQFINYDYILIYQLDCLVFCDELHEWCKKGYDYIGAPFIVSDKGSDRYKLIATGNGGLSLRKVDSFNKLLLSKDFYEDYYSLRVLSLINPIRTLIFIKMIFFLSRCLPRHYLRPIFLFQ